MTKEDKIKEAYGKFYDPENIDENGWTNTPNIDFINSTQCDAKEMHIVYGSPEWWYRPKSLSGIENNNGWIKIESEADLPKDSKSYYVKDKFGEVPYMTIFEEGLKDRWLEIITHYQPIQKPKPPIY